ncbi:prepilin peptidase [Oxalobacteraceae bacterium]|nr:prepilin peptidase [Oxalobacteraceae bacterium]
MINAIELILICLVTQAAVTDLAVRKIPNVLVISGLVLALVLHMMAGPPLAPATRWMAGCLTGFFLFLPLYMARGMAAGDVKLMAMVGAFTGPLLAVKIAVLACLTGGVMALAMLAANGRWRLAGRNMVAICQPMLMRWLGYPLAPSAQPAGPSAGAMPYGLAIAVATLAVVAWPHR